MNKKKFNSFIYAALLAETHICSIITTFIQIPNISVILIGIILVCTMLNNGLPRRIYYKAMVITEIILLVLMGAYIYNGAMFMQNYLLHFIVFGLTAIYIGAYDIDYWKMFEYVRNIFIIYMIVYVLVYRSVFLQSKDYWSLQMGIAYVFNSIAVVGIVETIHHNSALDRFISVIITLLALYFLLFDCGTRGAILAICFFAFSLLLMSLNSFRATIAVLLSFSLIGFICFKNLNTILLCIQGIVEKLGIQLPALDKTLSLALTSKGMNNARTPLYEVAIENIKNHPILGSGVGGYEKRLYLSNGQNVYVHQFILEVLCEFGVTGLLIFAYFMRKGLLVFLNKRENIISGDRMLGLVLLSLSMPMLSFSNSYWLAPNFWMFFSWCLYYDKRKRNYYRKWEMEQV